MTKSLVALLDDVSRRQGTPAASLEDICSEFLANPKTPKDWIYYFVKYPEMGSAPQGGYVFEESRFRACRLEGKYVYSFQDPYLLALVSKAGLSDKPGCFKENWNWFYGLQDESGPRPLSLSSVGVSIECVEAGWKINVSQEFPIELLPALNQTLQNHGVSLTDHLLRTVRKDDLTADSVDRIEKGAELLMSLVEIDSSKLSNSIPAALAQEHKFAESES